MAPNWEWENFESVIKSYRAYVSDAGVLMAPVQRFSITRDDDLQLILGTHAPIDAKDKGVRHPAGTVRQNVDRVEFSSELGLELIAEGVQPRSTHTIFNSEDGIEEVQQDCTIHRLEGTLTPKDRETGYVIEWIANLESAFIWPDGTEDIVETKQTRRVGSGPTDPVITASGTKNSSSSNAVRLVIGGLTLYVCSVQQDVAKDVRKPGYILYVGDVSKGSRERVRTCLSLTMGRYLVHLGHACFSADWSLLQFEAVSAYSIGGNVFKLPTLPPAPLHLTWEWGIDRTLLSRAVNAIYEKYECLNLANVNWAYWHAVAATPHIAGVHYGALLESLERSYLDSEDTKINRTLVKSGSWEALKSKLQKCVADEGLEKDVEAVLKNKIASNLNSAPQSIVTENVLSILGLTLGIREGRAPSLVRNQSAHGKDDAIDNEWIRNLNILRTRCHRMILAMTKASDFYYDYFTIGRPIRRLGEPMSD